jgi:integrase
MRIGEVLKLTPFDIDDRKAIIHSRTKKWQRGRGGVSYSGSLSTGFFHGKCSRLNRQNENPY